MTKHTIPGVTDAMLNKLVNNLTKEMASDLLRSHLRPLVRETIERAVAKALTTPSFKKRLETEASRAVRETLAETPLIDVFQDGVLSDTVWNALSEAMSNCAVTIAPGDPVTRSPKQKRRRR